eukprot:GHVT01028320.1.p1 GENE.GHVT01028320.1~~GHVT01028320.1.p1  ORF type:complete len:120 (-),score=9.01 GHVT01028320.1:226-585(-)
MCERSECPTGNNIWECLIELHKRFELLELVVQDFYIAFVAVLRQVSHEVQLRVYSASERKTARKTDLRPPKFDTQTSTKQLGKQEPRSHISIGLINMKQNRRKFKHLLEIHTADKLHME